MRNILTEKFWKMDEARVANVNKYLEDMKISNISDDDKEYMLSVLGYEGLRDVINEFLALVIRNKKEVAIVGVPHQTNLSTILTGKAYEGLYTQIEMGNRDVLDHLRVSAIATGDVSRNELFDMDKFLEGKQVVMVHGASYCFSCGDYVEVAIGVKGDKLLIQSYGKNDECYEDKDYTFDVQFKKGDVIHFGDWVGGPDSPASISLNAAKGLRDNTLFYAEHNIGYIFTGNSCPTLWINKERNKIIVGTPRNWRDEDWEIIPEKREGYEKLGSICTDLWACCFSTEREIAKHENQQIDRGEPLLTLDKDTVFRTTVHVNNGDDDDSAEFATIELI